MNRESVFKSEKGKEQIRAYYNAILNCLPLTKRYINTFYGKTFLLEAGDPDKEVIILLHGSCSNSAAWLGDIGEYAKQYHVFAIDIPGEPGNSEDNRLDITGGEYTDWLKAVMEVLGIEKSVIIGNSMGGWMALCFAAKYPAYVAKLVLMAPSGIIAPKDTFMGQIQEGSTDIILEKASLPKEVLEFMQLVMENFYPVTDPLSILSDAQMQVLTMPVLYMAGMNDETMNTRSAAARISDMLPQAVIELNEGTHVIITAVKKVIPFLKKK